MNRIIIVTSAFFTIAACQAPVDHTQTYQGDCYQLVKPSVLYNGWCPETDTRFASSYTCLGIQSLPFDFNDWNNSQLTSFEQYQKDPDFWNDMLFGTGLYARDYNLVGSVEPRSRLQVDEVVVVQWGTGGTLWAVTAKLLNGEHQGKRVTLPTYHHHLGVSWSVNYPWQGPLQLRSDYVVPCS